MSHNCVLAMNTFIPTEIRWVCSQEVTFAQQALDMSLELFLFHSFPVPMRPYRAWYGCSSRRVGVALKVAHYRLLVCVGCQYPGCNLTLL